MVRNESVGIANVMRAIQNAKPVDWNLLHSKDPAARLEFINNEYNYPVLFQELTNYIMEKVKPLKSQ